MQSIKNEKWDLKQLGVGGGSVLGLLFLFQSQGIDLMNKSQDARDDVIIEKTLANTQRITSLEQNVKDLNDKIDRGFDGVRRQLRDETKNLSEVMTRANNNSWTRTDQNTYRELIENRFRNIEYEITHIKDTIKK